MIFDAAEHKRQITEILSEASDAVMSVYRSDNFNTEAKADNSPITRADRLSNSIIIDGLSALSPSIPVISEETTHIPYQSRKDYGELWIVDPLDGTREFVNRNGEFCICLALISGRRPVAGFIIAPVTGELWYAFRGRGAWKVFDGTQIRLPLRQGPIPPVVLVSRSHHNDAEKEWIRKYSATSEAMVTIQGSAIKFCRLAEGSGTVYPKFGPINEWDVAAGDIILSEAGGEIIEIVSGKNPVYNKESLIQPHFIARSSSISDF
jgi:3'(2'), 5'-bisphosphate nucleotidase